MAFELENTVPWGRSMDEYKDMFHLSDADLSKRIISFGDGPASFNAEMTIQGKNIISMDPIYRFSADELNERINETKDIVITQTRNNLQYFVWNKIKNIDHLEKIRMSAMNHFLKDFEQGKREMRYVNHELPAKTSFDDCSFELGLSSHFLILYSQLGLEFHIAAIDEMLRVAREIRIFPILNLNGEKTELLDSLIQYYSKKYIVQIETVSYEFQKNGNQMLRINP